MAIAYRGASNAAGEAAGTTTTPTTVSITPTLPASTATGDRVFMIQCASNTSAASPSGWILLGNKDTVVGSGAVAAAGGLRYMTVYYRDYDGVWTMPAMTLTSAAQNSHWIGAVSLSKGGSEAWYTPTISSVGGSFNAATTSYTDTSSSSFTTHSGGFLITGTCMNDNVTASAQAVTQSGATFGTVTERCDGGTATGNDVAGKVHTCSVTTGASATITHTETISAASQGETLFIEQTVAPSALPALSTLTDDFSTQDTAKWRFNGGAVASGGQLLETPNSGYGDVIDTLGKQRYNFTGSYWLIEAVQAVNAGTGTVEMHLELRAHPESDQNRITFFFNNNSIHFRQYVAGSTAIFDNTAYNSTTHRWWRIRESGGTIYWDTSQDGYNWTNRANRPLLIDITSVGPRISTGYYGTEPTPGSAIWDNVNLPNSLLRPASATLTLTGQTPTVTTTSNQTVSPASATLTLTGQTPTITATTQDVEYDATGAGDTENATSTSWSHTLGASATGIIVGVTCSLSSTTTSGWTKSVTCGGVAMTLLGSQSINNSTSSSQVDLWALTSPPTGSQTIAVSYTLAANVPYLTGNSVSYNNVGSFGSAVLHWGNSNTFSSSAVSSATGRRVVSAFSGWYNLGSVTVSSPSGNSRYSLNGTSNTYAPTLIEDAAGAATVTNTASLSASPFWGAVSVDILQPAGTTLTPAGATLALTGQTPTVSVSNNFSVTPASASLALTGQTPTVLVSNHQVVSPAGEFLTLGVFHVPTITVSDHKVVSPASATLTLTGATPVVTATAHITLTPASATLTLTGQTPTVTVSNHQIAAPAGASLALTGGTPVVTASDHKIVAPTGASLTLTGSTPFVVVGDQKIVVPAGASLTLTGGTSVVTATAHTTLTPAGATLTLTGQTPTVTATAHKVVIPASATLALTGQTPTVAVTAHKTVTPAGATLALTGSTPSVTASDHHILQPAGAWLTLDVYHAPTIIVTHHLTVSPASAQFTLTGSVPVVLNPVYIMPQSAVLTLTGETPLVIWSAPVLPPEERRVLASVDSRLVVATVSDRMEIATLSDREE